MSKIKNYIILGLIIILGVSTCMNIKSHSEVKALKKENLFIDSVKNEFGKTVYSQTVELTSNKEAIKELSDSIFNLKKKHEKQVKEVIAFYSGRIQYEVDSIKVPYEDTSKYKKYSDSLAKTKKEYIDYINDSTVKIGTSAKVDTLGFKGDFTIQKKHLDISNISISDTINLRFVKKKGGLFKKNSSGRFSLITKGWTEVQILHSNPYFKSKPIQSVIYNEKNKPKILEKFILVGAGYILGKTL